MLKQKTLKVKSKTEIFTDHGIEYNPITGKIKSPLGWVNLVLVDGNEKIGKGIYHFSTLPGNFEYHINIALIQKEKISENKKSASFGKPVKYTALDEENPVFIDVNGTCVCNCVGCYAMTGNYNYDTTQAYLGIRTYLAWYHIKFLEAAISAQIEAEKIGYIRIHASGDFCSEEYATMWKRIATKYCNVVFWTYTKIKEYETLFDGLDNANIVKSIIPGKGKNYGHCDYVLALYEFLKSIGKTVYICRCGIDKKQHCTNCKGCSKNEYVLFIEHSTEYKAEKDPLFPILKKIIESQEIQ